MRAIIFFGIGIKFLEICCGQWEHCFFFMGQWRSTAWYKRPCFDFEVDGTNFQILSILGGRSGNGMEDSTCMKIEFISENCSACLVQSILRKLLLFSALYQMAGSLQEGYCMYFGLIIVPIY